MKKIPHFHDSLSGLREELRHEIRQRVTMRHYQTGEIILHQGQLMTDTYRIESGTVKISSYTEDGREIILTVFKEGDTFGEIGLLDGLPSGFTVECLTDTKVNILPGEDFLALLKQYPEGALELCYKLNRQVRILYELLLEAKSLPLHKRLISMLFRGLHSHTSEDTQGRYVNMSQEELARMLGTARQTLNRELKKLESLGYIKIQQGKIYYSDIERMRQDFKDIIHDDFLTPYY